MSDAASSLIGRLQAFESSLVSVDEHTFFAPALSAGSIVADFGAAGAGFALTLARQFGCRSYAAEAHPDVYGKIPADGSLTAFHVAISGVDGHIELKLRDAHHSSASFGTFHGLRDKGTVEVDSVTLEGFLKLAGLSRLDLLKVDIEGAEFAMFEAARDETLAAIGQITVEFHDFLDPSLTPSCLAIIRRLNDLGFSAIRFSRRYHGDVLFLNRRLLKISALRLAWFRHVVRPIRGIGRILSRLQEKFFGRSLQGA